MRIVRSVLPPAIAWLTLACMEPRPPNFWSRVWDMVLGSFEALFAAAVFLAILWAAGIAFLALVVLILLA